MGKKKQRKGAPDLDDDFPEPSEGATTVDTDIADTPAAAPKKQDKKKKAKKVNVRVQSGTNIMQRILDSRAT